MNLGLLRLAFILLLSLICFFLRPFGLAPGYAAALGALAAVGMIAVEMRARALSLWQLVCAAVGALAGLSCALFLSFVLEQSLSAGGTRSTLELGAVLLLTYAGLVLGANKGASLSAEGLRVKGSGEGASATAATPPVTRILDTSAIIDGRIADIAATGFLDGNIIVPEFVLRELQLVADSTEPSKRQRGRRGLDVLERMQSNANPRVRIVADDFPAIREVDLKLIELAKVCNARIVTNDFNLNKVAHLHQVGALNINDLANAMRPVVLPGEKMRIVIMKEGKEFDQGVGYLDDGTMVVVDHARRLIGREVEIGVTSVLQTASGKMIFGRTEEGTGKFETLRSVSGEIIRP